MTKKALPRLKIQFGLLIGLALALFIFVYLTSKSYSLIQSWKEYYSLEDWNLTMHAIVDIDDDGEKDMITFTNCAFLSSVKPDEISSENKCQEPGMSVIAFSDNSVSVGQKLVAQRPFNYEWLRKSYLVKTNNNIWKFYDMNGLQLKTYELSGDHLFKEVSPTFLDRIDVFTYQLSHLGIVLLFIALPH